MKKKYDVVALGELLIDFTDNGISGQGNTIFEANPGERLVMCLRCFKNWETKRLLSEKWGKIYLVQS